MTKAEIDALIATIQDGGLNPAEEVRTVYTGIADELYSDIVVDDETTTNVITKLTSEDIDYRIGFKKSGNQVLVYGYLKNQGGALIGANLDLATITDANYHKHNNANAFDIPRFTAITAEGDFGISGGIIVGNILRIFTPLPATTSGFMFNFTYKTLD